VADDEAISYIVYNLTLLKNFIEINLRVLTALRQAQDKLRAEENVEVGEKILINLSVILN